MGDRLRILKSSPDAEGRRTFLGASFIGNRVSLLAFGLHRRKPPHFGGSASKRPSFPDNLQYSEKFHIKVVCDYAIAEFQ
jgi:hypothetical protein